MSWWSFSHHLHTNFLVLFKAAHMSAENSSLLVPDLYLDANSQATCIQPAQLCARCLHTNIQEAPGGQLPFCLSASLYLSVSLPVSFISPSSLDFSLSLLYFQNCWNFIRKNSNGNKRITIAHAWREMDLSSGGSLCLLGAHSWPLHSLVTVT